MKKIGIGTGIVGLILIVIISALFIINQKNVRSTIVETGIESKTSNTNINDEQLKLFSKKEIEALSKQALSSSSIDSIYDIMQESKTWTSVGYSEQDGINVANRFKNSECQAKGILSDIVSNHELALKIVIIKKSSYSNVNIGSESLIRQETDESTTTSTEAALYSSKAPALDSIEQIEVTLKYDHKKAEINYKVEANQVVKAKYRNDYNDEELEGTVAQEKVEELFSGLSLQTSTESEIKEAILNKMKLSNNFKSFKLEITFSDQSERKFEIN